MLAAVLYPFSGLSGSNNGLLWWSALLWGLSGGWSVLWLFQGIQRVRQAGILDVSAKLLGTAGIFFLVHSPADGWKILAMQGGLSILANMAGATILYRIIPFVWPSRRDVLGALREGWAMFLFKSSAVAMLSSNTFVLGFFAPLERVGWYAAGEKISRSCWQLLSPLTQVLYPELARLTRFEAKRGRSMAMICTLGTSIVGLALGLVLYVSAPLAVQILMGKAFMPSVGVVRLLAWLGPMVALNSAVAFYWLFPAGLEGPYTRLVIGAVVVDILLNAILAPRFAETGTALAVILAEATILGGAILLLRARMGSGRAETGNLAGLAVSSQGGD
jgi:PST family polysaccharide transporter